MKKLGKGLAVSLTAACIVQVMPMSASVAATETYYYGDMDGNGILNAADLSLMKRTLGTEMSDTQQEIADLDDSGAFDMPDLQCAREKVLPCVQADSGRSADY